MFFIQEKEPEEEEDQDTFDMNIKITDPEKVGMYNTKSFQKKNEFTEKYLRTVCPDTLAV